jgi:hypothetical protein
VLRFLILTGVEGKETVEINSFFSTGSTARFRAETKEVIRVCVRAGELFEEDSMPATLFVSLERKFLWSWMVAVA